MWRNTKLPQGDPAVHLQAALKNTGSLWLQQPPPRLCIPGHHHLHGSFLHSALTWGGRGTCPTIPLRLNSAYTVQILGCRKGISSNSAEENKMEFVQSLRHTRICPLQYLFHVSFWSFQNLTGVNVDLWLCSYQIIYHFHLHKSLF